MLHSLVQVVEEESATINSVIRYESASAATKLAIPMVAESVIKLGGSEMQFLSDFIIAVLLVQIINRLPSDY